MDLDLPRPSPSPTSDRLAHIINALVIIILFVYAFVTYSALPEKIPIHFTIHGVPDNYADKSWGTWLMLPLTALGLTCLFYATTYLVDVAKKHPKWLSLPKKKEFLALPEEKQAPIWHKMKTMLYWMSVPMNLLILYAFHTVYTMAMGTAESLVMWPVWACMGAILIITFGMTYGLIRSVRTAVEKHQKESAG
ncbi:DUF1648 domain-containing protein [Myxococcota bacterium]